MGKSIADQLDDLNVKEKVSKAILTKAANAVLAKKRPSSRKTPCRKKEIKRCGKYKELAKNEACAVVGCSYVKKPIM